MSEDLKPVKLTAIDTVTQEWGGFPMPQLGVELPAMPLIDDPDTGMQVLKIIYRAGWTNPWHTQHWVLLIRRHWFSVDLIRQIGRGAALR